MRLSIGFLAAATFASSAHAGLLTAKATPGQTAFSQCDGYLAPSKKADNLTTGGWLFGLASTTVDQRRSKTPLGAQGVASCDVALADPLLQPAFVMRRAHLLQAKAIHQIAAGQFDAALGSLSRSDEVGRAEQLFDQSVGQGNRALRAVALNGLGKKAEANAELDRLEQHRPWASSQRQLAMRVRMQFDDDLKSQLAIMEKVAPVLPSAKHQLFWMSMLYDDFGAALNHAQGMSHADAKDHGNWRGTLDDFEKYLDVIEQAQFNGAIAYAQFAVGQREASAATMARAKSAVEATMDPLPPLEEGQSYSKKQKLDYERRKQAGDRSLSILKDWTATINLRSEAPALTVDEIMTKITAEKIKVPTLSDIIAHAKLADLNASAGQQALLKEINGAKDEQRLKGVKMDFDTLVSMLPRPETPTMGVRYKREDGLLGSGLDGFAVQRGWPAGANTVRFGSGRGTLAAVDEGVMLAAAQFAQSAGKDSFVIDTREPIQRTIQYYGLYSGGGTSPSGYEVRLVVRPVNAAEATAGERGRLINVAAVNAALASRLIIPTR